MEEGKKVMGDLLQSEEAKEMLDLSKSLLSEFTSSEMVTNAISKMKSTWNEKGEELTERGKELVEKGVEEAQKAQKKKEKEEKKKGKKDKKGKKGKKESSMAERSAAVLDTVVENRAKIAEMGMKVLEKVREDDTGKKVLDKGLEYMKQIQKEGGIEGALKKGQALLADEQSREEMIGKVKDTVFDFLIKVSVRPRDDGSTFRRSTCRSSRGNTRTSSTRSPTSTSPASS